MITASEVDLGLIPTKLSIFILAWDMFLVTRIGLKGQLTMMKLILFKGSGSISAQEEMKNHASPSDFSLLTLLCFKYLWTWKEQ